MLTTLAIPLLVSALGPTGPGNEPAASVANVLAAELRSKGWTRAGSPVRFPAPRFTAGQSEADERAALVALAGSERGAAELTRDAVTAPFVVKTTDVVTEGGTIRRADLWFVVHARLDEVDPDTAAAGTRNGQPIEAGNMKFTARELSPTELGARQVLTDGRTREWFVHTTGRLLDRLEVEASDRILAQRDETGWEIASITCADFDDSPTAGNRWRAIARRGAVEQPGAWQPYAGGASVVSIRKLATVPGALIVEAHFTFFEPKAWFDGAPVLRSKIALVAQDRVRSLRRDVARSRKAGGARTSRAGGPAPIEAAAGGWQNVGRAGGDGPAPAHAAATREGE